MNFYSDLIVKARKRVGFNDYPLMLIGIPTLAFLMPVIFFQASLSEGFISYCPKWGVGIIFTAYYWIGNRSIISLFRKRYVQPSENKKRILLQSLSMILFVVISSLSIDYIQHDLMELQRMPGTSSKTDMIIPSLFSTLAIVSIYEATYYINQWNISIAETEKLKRENALSQLYTLRSQVNPHFLFNSLNTLSSLIPEDANKAVEFVQNLSKVYRYILEIGDQELITLREELTAIDAYSFLVRSRFGSNIEIRMEIPDALLDKYIVPLSMQMVLENAIKHNVVSTKKPLLIEVFNRENAELIVRNNLQKKQQVSDSTGVGLKNISNRYELISGENIDVMVSESHYAVALPLIDVKVYEHSDS